MCILSFTACLLKPQSILNFKGRFAFVSKSIPLVIILRKQQIAEYLLYLCSCFQIICHQAHWSGVGHVTTKTYRVAEPTGPVLVMAALTDIPINNYIPRRKSGIYWIQVRRAAAAAAAVEISLWTR